MPRLNNTKLRCAIGPSNRLHLMKTQAADGIFPRSSAFPPAWAASHLLLFSGTSQLWIPGSVIPVGPRTPELILSTHWHGQGQPGWPHTCSSPSQPDTGKPLGRRREGGPVIFFLPPSPARIPKPRAPRHAVKFSFAFSVSIWPKTKGWRGTREDEWTCNPC